MVINLVYAYEYLLLKNNASFTYCFEHELNSTTQSNTHQWLNKANDTVAKSNKT